MESPETNIAMPPKKSFFGRMKLRWKFVAIYWAIFLLAGLLFLIFPLAPSRACSWLFCIPYAFVVIAIISFPGIAIAELFLGVLRMGKLFGIDSGAIELTGITLFTSLFYYAVGVAIEARRDPENHQVTLQGWNTLRWFVYPFLLGLLANGALTLIPNLVADVAFPAESYMTGGIVEILGSSLPYLAVDALLLFFLVRYMRKGQIVSKKLLLAAALCNVIGFYLFVYFLPQIFCLFQNCG